MTRFPAKPDTHTVGTSKIPPPFPIFRALANLSDRTSVFAAATIYHARLPPYLRVPVVILTLQSTYCIVDVGGGLGHVSETLLAQKHTGNVYRAG
ncbi:MAG: hypothetical protein Q9223_006004 [Gallowayella weberi]